MFPGDSGTAGNKITYLNIFAFLRSPLAPKYAAYRAWFMGFYNQFSK